MPARDFFIKYRIASLVPNIWLVKKFVWFVIIKWKTHFSFPQMTLLVWLSCICQLSPMWYNIDCSQLLSWFDHYQLQLVYPTVELCPVRNLQHESSQTTFDIFDQSLHILHTVHKSLFCVFSFLEIIKHNTPKFLCIFFHLEY